MVASRDGTGSSATYLEVVLLLKALFLGLGLALQAFLALCFALVLRNDELLEAEVLLAVRVIHQQAQLRLKSVQHVHAHTQHKSSPTFSFSKKHNMIMVGYELGNYVWFLCCFVVSCFLLL